MPHTLGEIEIPYPSLVEFTVNALVHRSLNLKSPVRIFIFDNRLEIHSPGTLPNGLTVEDLVSGVSFPRNELLFNSAIHLLPYAGAGSGVTRALETGIDVSFKSNEGTMEFLVTIPRKEHHIDSSGSGKTHQESNQGAIKSNEGGLESNEGSPKSNQGELTMVTRPPITKKQLDIVNFCSVPRTTKEIMDRLGITNQTKNRQHYITELIEKGYLELTIPEYPTHMDQKYRRVQK